jgi:hypothetical protein
VELSNNRILKGFLEEVKQHEYVPTYLGRKGSFEYNARFTWKNMLQGISI